VPLPTLPKPVASPEPAPPAPQPARPEPPVEVTPTPARPAEVVVKRRRDLSEDDLRKQIAKVVEIQLDRSPERQESRHMVALARAAAPEVRNPDAGPLAMRQRPDLAGLPFRMGDACHLSPPAAEHLEGGSLALRGHMSQSIATAAAGPAFAGDTRPDAGKLHAALNADGQRHNKWLRSEAVPALQQLLMAENEAIRDVLVDQLARIPGKKATAALAQRALFDLHPEVRKAALVALNKRPVEEFRQTLLEGFRYPWQAVADHAAEALVALGLKDTVPALLALLDQPDPGEMFTRPGKEGAYVREMVRINHLRNCLMCHQASLDFNDKVRGRVPPTDQPLPPPFTRQYYSDNTGTFVRADITYLQQDFSVPLEVKNHGPWPAVQRYDFLVRERPATLAEVRAARQGEPKSAGEYHKAIFFALRELTGKDPGPTAEDWKRVFLGAVNVTPRAKDFQALAGVAADAAGRLFLSDAECLWRIEPGGRPITLAPRIYRGLALDAKGRLLACGKGRVVVIDTQSGAVSPLIEKYHDRPLAGPVSLAVDRQGGVYFTDAPAPSLSGGTTDRGAVYYVSAQGVVTRLPLALNRPGAVALSPDEKTLYVLAAGSQEVFAYPLEGTGLPGAGKVLFHLDGPDGSLAVDPRGHLYVTNPALRAVQVFNTEGARLGQALLPDAPLHCAVGGEGGRTLYVTTRTAVYAVQADAGLVAR
jgi:sugar lactone lactonase YvrE